MKLYEQICNDLQQRIEQGLYAGGDKLPSIRALSHEYSVSVTTVQEAYRQLEDRGFSEPRPKSGNFVRQRMTTPPMPEVSPPARRPLEVSQWEHVLDMLGAENSATFSLGHAMPDLSSPTLKPLMRLWADQTRRSDMRGLEYDSLRGTLELRQQIARLALNSGCHLHPDDLIITTGCQEALSCALRAITQPGDVVAVDSPCFYGAMQAIKAQGLKVMEIPTHPETGISIEALELAMEQWPIKVIIVTPTCNNPLGYTMPDDRKQALYQLAQRYDIAIIEDDIYGDLAYAYPRPRTVKSFDDDGRVLLCSSFSKTLAPGLREGWIAPGRYREQVIHNKFVATAASSTMPQLAVAEFIARGEYDRHLRRMRAQYQRNREQMITWLEQHLPQGVRISYPQGGYLLWLALPDQIDCVELNKTLGEYNLSIAPGVLFSASGKYRNCMRLNFTRGLEARTKEALEILVKEVKKKLQPQAGQTAPLN
ncbi:MAG: PLP-dependent aminotransferase family protein [Pontibacterium sp.]